ncbi:uncharacterized protein TNCV_3862841 [Trichonephila clavipes]|uniref:Uncharacterized protein n=1 Tax=Trichonephila clavipes TaxID=2585209 RepID=A0A8X6S796_TRICX|nr:uncharacterized protein TNCV_3862841 [Trichonephila clavipes]
MTARRYVRNIMQPHVFPLMQRLPGAIFQQDNARPHMTRMSQDFPHCYYPSLACLIPRFVSNRAYLGSFGTTRDTSSQNHKQSLSSISLSPENPVSKTFIPDYTVVTITETLYMKIHWAVYLAAYRATLMERHHKIDPESEEIFNNNWEQNFQFSSSGSLNHLQLDANSINTASIQNNNKRSGHSPIMNRTSNRNDLVKRRASVEVGCISRCPDVVISDGIQKNQSRESLVKTSVFSNVSEIPMIDMPHNLNSVAEDENCDSVEVVSKKLKDGISGKKKNSVNGTAEQTNERTRLLYPSEA